jgi:hypothetical protein
MREQACWTVRRNSNNRSERSAETLVWCQVQAALKSGDSMPLKTSRTSPRSIRPVTPTLALGRRVAIASMA